MKPFDTTKLLKDINKSLNIQAGFHDPQIWIDTGNYALNYRISSGFRKGVPLSKVTVFAGESGSGKSYVVSGNLVRNAQKMGILPVIFDTEFALDEAWLQALGVDTSHDKLHRMDASLVDEVADMINRFMKDYIEQYRGVPKEEQQPVLFIIDSLGMLSTPTEVDQFQKGDMKGDMGRKAKQLKALVTQCLKLMGPYNVGLVATNHTYQSQDMFNPDDVVSGGRGFVYASSIVVTMNKLKLKEDEDGVKTSTVQGIRSKMKCVKSRYAKPFEEVEVKIPYTTGMNPYSGLIEMFTAMGLIVKDGNRIKWIDPEGVEHKYYKKDFPDEVLDMIMDYVEARGDDVGEGFDETPTDEDKED